MTRLTKICRVCWLELPVERFPLMRDKRKPKPYFFYACFECKNKANLQYYHYTKLPLKIYDYAYHEKRKKEIRRYMRLYMRKYRKLFINPCYKAVDMRPRVNYTSPSPSPEDWQEASKESQKRILARVG